MSRNISNAETECVLSALKNTSKGRLSYDRNWKEEGRAQEIISEVKIQFISSIGICPKNLPKDKETENTNEIKSKHSVKYKVTENVNTNRNKVVINEKIQNLDNELSQENSKHENNSINKNESISEIDFINYEKERQELVRTKVEKHVKGVENYQKEFDERIEEELRLIRRRFTLASIKRTNVFEEEYNALKEEIVCQQTSFDDNSLSPSFKLKEIESKHQLLVEEQEKKQQELKRKQVLFMRSKIDAIVQNVIHLSNSSENELRNSELFHCIQKDLHFLISLVQSIDILLTKTHLTDIDINNVQNYELTANNMKIKIVSEIEKVKQSIQQKPKESIVIENNRLHDIAINDQSVISNKNENLSTNSSNALSESVEYKAFKEFLNLQKISDEFENTFKAFMVETKFKQKRNDLQLYIKTTINSISCESVEHIRDKLNRLTLLFSEKKVEYGGKKISCDNKDGSLNFCISLASKMFISVSTKQKDIALTMAPIIVLLWSRFPTFGQIFMAQMQEKCPYIIPYYPKPDNDGNESKREHLIACGYTIGKDGTEESEESFLNRMRAMVKLYAAIIQSNVENNHPHDLNHGWSWIARLLNLEPKTAITAAVLESFLSITSHKFYRFYRKQFIKIIKFIALDYMTRIENVTQKGTKRQSLVKLQMFISNIKKKLESNVNPKDIEPEGLIPNYFFQSSYSYSLGTQSFS